ncbi:MAG: hypothetical protein RLZZ143_748, partial [Cyanobacteriota bacterium]
MLIGILAVLSAAAAAGLRTALPLLVIGLLRTNLWQDVPLLSRLHPQVLLAILVSWSLFELFGSKSLLGQRVLQIISLFTSPLVGALMSLTMVKMLQLNLQPLWLIAGVGGLLAFVIKLVQVGWFFRLHGLPIWVTLSEEFLCIILVFFALSTPENGGLIALLVAMTPVFVAILRFIFGDKPSLKTSLGVLIGIVGVAVLVRPTADQSWYTLIPIASTVIWAVGSFWAQKIELPKSALTTAAWETMFGGLCAIGVGILRGERTAQFFAPHETQ